MIQVESPIFTPAQFRGEFDDLIFTPLDLPTPPTIDAHQFVEWMASDSMKTGTFPKERYERLTGLKYPWLMRSVVGDMGELERKFPQVLSYAKLYPFKSIRTIIFLAQDGHQAVFPHSDSDGLTGMRFYLENRHVEGLHFYKGLKPYDSFNSAQFDKSGNPVPVQFEKYFDMSKAIYARFPEDSRAFMLNSARAIHGIDANTCQLGDRIAVLVQGELDREKFDTLIARSLERFKGFAIWF